MLRVEGKDWKLILEKKKNKRQKIHTHTNKASPRKRRKKNVAVVELKIRRWGQQEKWELRPGSTKIT